MKKFSFSLTEVLRPFYICTAVFLFISAGTPFFSQENQKNNAELNSTSEIPFDYSEYVLENGMELYATQDFSSATVRIEYTVKAGISSQSKENTGFFTLYTRLFKNLLTESENGKIFKDLQAECTADSSRFSVTVPPSQVNQTLQALAAAAFQPFFSDKAINQKLSELKTEVMQYANSPAGFINSSIDSRVFSDAPWKQDSGIYPALFNSATPSKARPVLNQISKTYYTPQNSALFISGAINKTDALYFADKSFGQFSPRLKNPEVELIKAGGKSKKFVIYDPQFSEEISQVIIQYVSMNMEQSDILADAFDSPAAPFKNFVMNNPNLNIRGLEYINAASAHKNGTSRIIFQTLLEQSKVTPCQQAENFLETVKKAADLTDQFAFKSAQNRLSVNFKSVLKDSVTFMDYLAQFWAVEPYVNLSGDGGKSLAEEFLQRPEQIFSENLENLKKLYDAEEPFVFLLLNNKIYNKYKTALKTAGYEAVNISNGSWYTQKLYKNASSNLKEEKITQESGGLTTPQDYSELFISENQASISNFRLSNGIPVTVRKNPSTTNALILIGIKGGKLTGNRPTGFNQVMTNAFATNIQNEILKQQFTGAIRGNPEVLAETGLSYSSISTECQAEELDTVLQCISDSLIFGEIMPADADSYVYSVQTQKRLYNASAVNQLTSRAIKFFYSDSKYKKAFDSENDILETTSYTDILAAYPEFLDSSLYNMIITGNVDPAAVKETLKTTFGLLTSQKKTDISALQQTAYSDLSDLSDLAGLSDLSDPSVSAAAQKQKFPVPAAAKNKKITVKLRHLFYTDVAAKDAGPMPAVLVPTKDFSDPVQYWYKAPDFYTTDFQIFNCLSQYLAEIIEEKALSSGAAGKVQLFCASKEVPVASFTLLNVKHTNQADSVVLNTIKNLKADLKNQDSGDAVVLEIINKWILLNLTETDTNRGTAVILNNNFHDYNNSGKFLETYRTITSLTKEKLSEVLENWFTEDFQLRLYSSDSKK